MSRDPAVGRYRIQAVVEMTGVSAATLRAWERRYGIPKPQRSGASYRLYSDSDVESIRRLSDLCTRGMAPSEAARLIAQAAEAPAPEAEPPVIGGDPFEGSRKQLLAAIEAADVSGLNKLMERSLAVASAMQVLDRIIVPVLREVGDRWHRGELSVAAEHLASEQLGNTTRRLMRLLAPDDPRGQAVLACVDWETHAIPLYAVAARWSQWGLSPVVLGARLPASELSDAVTRMSPKIVGLSATVDPPARVEAEAALKPYAEACGSTPWIVGGAQAESWRGAIETLGGHVAPPSTTKLRALVDDLVG